VTNISGMGTFSSIANLTWTVPTGGVTGSNQVTPGWLGSPLPYTVVQGQQIISLGQGLTLTSGIVDYWPTSNPNLVTVLNANASGGGGATLATFDGTLVADGEYVRPAQRHAEATHVSTSLIPLKVTGENKPGRFSITVTDLTIQWRDSDHYRRTYDSCNAARLATSETAGRPGR